MKYVGLFIVLVLNLGFLRAADGDSSFAEIRIEVTRFEPKRLVAIGEKSVGNAKQWISEIQYRVVWPERFKGLAIIEHCSEEQIDSSFIGIGNLLSASAPAKLLESKDKDAKGRIIASECLRNKRVIAICH